MQTSSPDVQQAIDDFVAQNSESNKDLGALIKVFQEIKLHGDAIYRWDSLKHLVLIQLQNVLDEYKEAGEGKLPPVDGESFEVRYGRLKQFLNDFAIPPFTIQRMAELLIEPRRHYRNADTFFFSFCKLVYGISGTLDFQNSDALAEDAREAFKKKAKIEHALTPAISLPSPVSSGSKPSHFAAAAAAARKGNDEPSLPQSPWVDKTDLPT